MTYIKESTVKRNCPTCKQITEHYKTIDLCIECFTTNPPRKKPSIKNKQYFLY